MQVMTSNEILHLPNIIYVLDAKDAKIKGAVPALAEHLIFVQVTANNECKVQSEQRKDARKTTET